tara:strand:+ start:993 stop:1253 length:261 start_codon:yes stop_codon:yes gene_type:complete
MFSFIYKFIQRKKNRNNKTIITTKDKLIYQLELLRQNYDLANYHYHKLIDKNCKIMDIEIASEWIIINRFKTSKTDVTISDNILKN